MNGPYGWRKNKFVLGNLELVLENIEDLILHVTSIFSIAVERQFATILKN